MINSDHSSHYLVAWITEYLKAFVRYLQGNCNHSYVHTYKNHISYLDFLLYIS